MKVISWVPMFEFSHFLALNLSFTSLTVLKCLLIQEGGRIMLTKPGPLELDMTIFPLRWDDTANYTCIAKNKGGVHVWNGTIFVQCTTSVFLFSIRCTFGLFI